MADDLLANGRARLLPVVDLDQPPGLEHADELLKLLCLFFVEGCGCGRCLRNGDPPPFTLFTSLCALLVLLLLVLLLLLLLLAHAEGWKITRGQPGSSTKARQHEVGRTLDDSLGGTSHRSSASRCSFPGSCPRLEIRRLPSRTSLSAADVLQLLPKRSHEVPEPAVVFVQHRLHLPVPDADEKACDLWWETLEPFLDPEHGLAEDGPVLVRDLRVALE